VEQPTGLTLSIKLKGLALDEDDHKFYAPIGRIICHVSKLEFELDEYMFLFRKKFPKMTQSLSSAFPKMYSDKIRFFVETFICYSPLRRIGDANGELNLNTIGYLFEQLFDARNHLAHGAIYFSETTDMRTVYTAEKYTRIKGKKQSFQKDKYKFSTIFLDQLFGDCLYLKALIRNAVRLLNGEDVPRERDDFLKDQARKRELFAYFKDNNIEVKYA